MPWAGWYVVICVLTLLALIIQIIGFSTPGWLILNSNKIRHLNTAGLWMECTESSCAWINDDFIVPRWLRAVRALQCMTTGAIIIAGCFSIYGLTDISRAFGSAVVNAILSAFCCLNIVISVIIYGSMHAPGRLYYSFALTIIAGGFNFAVVVLCFYMTRAEKRSEKALLEARLNDANYYDNPLSVSKGSADFSNWTPEVSDLGPPGGWNAPAKSNTFSDISQPADSARVHAM